MPPLEGAAAALPAVPAHITASCHPHVARGPKANPIPGLSPCLQIRPLPAPTFPGYSWSNRRCSLSRGAVPPLLPWAGMRAHTREGDTAQDHCSGPLAIFKRNGLGGLWP